MSRSFVASTSAASASGVLGRLIASFSLVKVEDQRFLLGVGSNVLVSGSLNASGCIIVSAGLGLSSFSSRSASKS